jgi:hypothetical protein
MQVKVAAPHAHFQICRDNREVGAVQSDELEPLEASRRNPL